MIGLEMVGLDRIRNDCVRSDRVRIDPVRNDRVRNDWVRNDRIRNDRLPFLIPMFLFNVDILYLFRFIFKSFYSLQTHAYLIIQHTKLLNVKNFEV